MQYVLFFGAHLFTSRPQELVGDAVCRNSPKKTTNGVAHTRRCDPPSVKLKNETNNVKFGKNTVCWPDGDITAALDGSFFSKVSPLSKLLDTSKKHIASGFSVSAYMALAALSHPKL